MASTETLAAGTVISKVPFSGWVFQFLVSCWKRSQSGSVPEFGRMTARPCRIERMLAHALTADIRVERYGEKSGPA